MEFRPEKIARAGRRCQRPGTTNLLTSARRHCYIHGHGGVAKLVIALACQAGGRGFKSRRSRSFSSNAMHGGSGSRAWWARTGAIMKSHSSGCSAVGSAFGSGPKGRRFKPAQPDFHAQFISQSPAGRSRRRVMVRSLCRCYNDHARIQKPKTGAAVPVGRPPME